MDSSNAQPNAAASVKISGNFNSGICQTDVWEQSWVFPFFLSDFVYEFQCNYPANLKTGPKFSLTRQSITRQESSSEQFCQHLLVLLRLKTSHPDIKLLSISRRILLPVADFTKSLAPVAAGSCVLMHTHILTQYSLAFFWV
jgi:hypothetical protein